MAKEKKRNTQIKNQSLKGGLPLTCNENFTPNCNLCLLKSHSLCCKSTQNFSHVTLFKKTHAYALVPGNKQT